MKAYKFLLFPFSGLYGLILMVRHTLYDLGILRSKAFDIPVLVVGNLIVGGAGKSPIVMYLAQMLVRKYKLAMLSRGYGRNTRGFRLVHENSQVKEVGDEPLQFKCRFHQVTVAVCEDRVEGIQQLYGDHDVILLDDGFQHRALRAGFNILLFDYPRLSEDKFLLPVGNYRDLFNRRKNADIVIISKCPEDIAEECRLKVEQSLNLPPDIPVYFSFLTYGAPVALYLHEQDPLMLFNQGLDVLLISGIANPKPLQEYLQPRVASLKIVTYPDHHLFSLQDVTGFLAKFDAMQSRSKCIFTTEKDAMRLKDEAFVSLLGGYPVYYIPIEAHFLQPDEQLFEQAVWEYCSKNSKTFSE